MGRVLLHMSVSLDGYSNDAGGQIDWWSVDEQFNAYIDGMLTSVDAMIFGRRAFEELAAFWPHAGEEMSEVQVRRMHDLPKYVLSETVQTTSEMASLVPWHNAFALGSDPAHAIRELASTRNHDVAVFAGAATATATLALGVVDELHLVVHPILLGGGTRLFGDGYPRAPLALTDVQQFTSGVMVVRYDLQRGGADDRAASSRSVS